MNSPVYYSAIDPAWENPNYQIYVTHKTCDKTPYLFDRFDNLPVYYIVGIDKSEQAAREIARVHFSDAIKLDINDPRLNVYKLTDALAQHYEKSLKIYEMPEYDYYEGRAIDDDVSGFTYPDRDDFVEAWVNNSFYKTISRNIILNESGELDYKCYAQYNGGYIDFDDVGLKNYCRDFYFNNYSGKEELFYE